MRTKGKVSKVAICKRCNKNVQACHIDHISKEIENDFTKLTNEGFLIKLETINATMKRDFALFSKCSNKACSLS